MEIMEISDESPKRCRFGKHSLKSPNTNEVIKIILRVIVSSKSSLITFIFIILIILLKTFLEVQVPSYLGDIAQSIGADPEFLMTNYKKYLISFSVFLILINITPWILIPMIKKVFTEIGAEQIEKIFQLSHEDFKKVEVTYYVSNLNRCANAVADFLEAFIIKFFHIISLMAFSTYKLYSIFGMLVSFIFLDIVIIFFLCTYVFTLARIKYHIMAIEQDNSLQNHLFEKLHNRDTVLMSDMVEEETKNLRSRFEKYQKNSVIFSRFEPNLHICQDLIFYPFYFILMFKMVCTQDMLFEKRYFIASFTLLVTTKSRLNSLGSVMQLVYEASANISAGYLLLKTQQEKTLQCEKIHKISFIKYSKCTNANIFDEVTLDVDQPGSYIVVGPNGAGKSTFVKSIMAFYNNKEGIFINDTALKDLNLRKFQSKIVYANQECQLFSGSILYNLQYGNNKTFQEIEDLCNTLKITKMVLSKPGGYSYKIGKGGCNLTGGEKQKLVIARSILRNADVYIFDEPTSNIDDKSERALLHTTNYLLREKIVFYIIHNLNLVTLFDKVIFINNKQVSKPKPFKELIEIDEEFSRFMEASVYTN
ncbi:hypothetical protein CDIK_0532 [Cucumispora dikerogammari]|nr:hypothetical protein CDIK_0532 [Cucumispora dikerogammari]